MMLKREIVYIGLPVLLYLAVLGINEWIIEDWKEFPQYILLSGTIFTGFIAMYISKSSEARERKMKQENREVQLQNIRKMLAQGITEISKELENYDKIKKKVEEFPFKDQPFEVGSFYFLSEIAKWDKEYVFDYFVHSDLGTIDEKEEKYIRVIKNVNNANFVYDLFERNKIEFVRNHNIQSRVLKDVDQNFQDIYIEVVRAFENGIVMKYYLDALNHEIVNNYNIYRSGDDDYQYSIAFYRVELIDKIRGFVEEYPIRPFSQDLRTVINQYISVISKFEDNVKNFSGSIDKCAEQLEEIRDNLDIIFPD